jgi:hypothetical protein
MLIEFVAVYMMVDGCTVDVEGRRHVIKLAPGVHAGRRITS